MFSKNFEEERKSKAEKNNIYIYIYEVHKIGFVWAFKIDLDTWKFSMLLLYILWDDWPIFIISGSNELLQKELEYTLLKPDCHSWWFSKMQSDTFKERYAIKFCFKLGKNTTETYRMLQSIFGASCRNRASVFEWHTRFKEGRESVRDYERCGRSKEVNTPQLIGQRFRVRFWRMQSTPSLPSFPSPLLPGVVISDRALSRG